MSKTRKEFGPERHVDSMTNNELCKILFKNRRNAFDRAQS